MRLLPAGWHFIARPCRIRSDCLHRTAKLVVKKNRNFVREHLHHRKHESQPRSAVCRDEIRFSRNRLSKLAVGCVSRMAHTTANNSTAFAKPYRFARSFARSSMPPPNKRLKQSTVSGVRGGGRPAGGRMVAPPEAALEDFDTLMARIELEADEVR
jgi:hypothetical protein